MAGRAEGGRGGGGSAQLQISAATSRQVQKMQWLNAGFTWPKVRYLGHRVSMRDLGELHKGKKQQPNGDQNQQDVAGALVVLLLTPRVFYVGPNQKQGKGGDETKREDDASGGKHGCEISRRHLRWILLVKISSNCHFGQGVVYTFGAQNFEHGKIIQQQRQQRQIQQGQARTQRQEHEIP